MAIRNFNTAKYLPADTPPANTGMIAAVVIVLVVVAWFLFRK